MKHIMDSTTRAPRQFFDLPRELRDEVYRYYSHGRPRTTSALTGYVDVPSPALLRTCKQIHQELHPIFQEGLKAALLHKQVCMKLSKKNPDGGYDLAGWNRFNEDRFDIWVRTAPHDDSEIAWLVDLIYIWQKGPEDVSPKRVGNEVFQLLDKLNKLSMMPVLTNADQYPPAKLGRRLYSVQSRVEKVARKLREQERARVSAQHVTNKALKECQSQSNVLQITPRASYSQRNPGAGDLSGL